MTVTCISHHWGMDGSSEVKVNHDDELDLVSITTVTRSSVKNGEIVEVSNTVKLGRAQFGMLIRNAQDQLVELLQIKDIRQLIIKGILSQKGFGSIEPEQLLWRLSEHGARECIDRQHAIAITDAYRSPSYDNEGLDSLIEDLKVLEAI